MDNPYLSVIIACYNGQAYIESAIRSILNQPYKNIELIVVNDGSTDKTSSICESYASQDQRVRHLYIKNHGAGYARNYGIDHAKGTWILFLDCDDLFFSEALSETLIEKLQSWEKQRLDIIYTPRYETDMFLTQPLEVRKAVTPSDSEPVPNNEIWTAVYSRKFLQDKQIRFYEYRRQDVESAYRYLAFINADRTEVDNSHGICLHRTNQTGNTHSANYQIFREVKCLVYYDLYKNHSMPQSKNYLLKVTLIELSRYFNLCWREGIFDPTAYENMYAIKKDLWSAKNAPPLIGWSRFLISSLQQFFVVLFQPNYRRKKADNSQNLSTSYAEPKDIMERLREASAIIYNE